MSKTGVIIGVILLIICFVVLVVGLPVLLYVSQQVSQYQIPIVSQVTYTAHISTLTRQHVRYNVVSWNIIEGDVPATYTVTLYYLGGQSETFHWVLNYNFERENQ